MSEGLPPIVDPMETVSKLVPVVAPIDVMSLNDEDGMRQKPMLRRGLQRYEEEPSNTDETDDSGLENEDEPPRPGQLILVLLTFFLVTKVGVIKMEP